MKLQIIHTHREHPATQRKLDHLIKLVGGFVVTELERLAAGVAQLKTDAAENKAAAAQAARDLDDLKAKADAIKAKLDEINKTFGDLTVIDDFETLSQTFVRNRSELQRLEEGFDSLMGTVGRSVQDALRDIIEKGKLTDLNVNPAFSMTDFKAVPKEWRDKIPEYVKDYVSLNQFMQ